MPRLCGFRNSGWFWPVVLGVLVLVGTVPGTSADEQTSDKTTSKAAATATETKGEGKLAKAVVAGGCFWCTEAVFEEIEGVVAVVSGYAGGDGKQANYRAVSSGQTGHAEVIEITYNSAQLDYETLLEVFFDAHDPTQKNRQGPDVGTQYRSAIFYANEGEKEMAEKVIDRINMSKKYKKPIATTLEKLEKFYPAEEYHQDYSARNPFDPYVRQSSTPKVLKVRKQHSKLLKPKAGAGK
ncbi:MAG: peptide-methionine (S)-S-oxide reductase MsrA [Planctomycetaceae bacterium]|jgi:methionine-S-sulfoxide reductase